MVLIFFFNVFCYLFLPGKLDVYWMKRMLVLGNQ